MACDAKCQEEAAKRREVGAWSSPEREALLRRIRPTMADATTDDLLEFARVELNDALDNVDPIEGGSAFHAGCCMMRAEAAIFTVQKRLRESAKEKGYTVDDSPEAKARVRERFGGPAAGTSLSTPHQCDPRGGPWHAGAIGRIPDDDSLVYREDAVRGAQFCAASPKEAEAAAHILNELESKVRATTVRGGSGGAGNNGPV